MFAYPKVVPKLTEDISLKEARTEEGAIKTASEVLGKVDDPAWDGTSPEATVISLLKGICDKTAPPAPTPIIPIATKITNAVGVAATYGGTYDGSSTLTVSSTQILMIYKDQGTYYDIICMGPSQSWTPGSTYTGYHIYQGVTANIGFAYRFTLLDENDNPLLEFADSSYQGVADTHLYIHKAILLLDLPTN